MKSTGISCKNIYAGYKKTDIIKDISFDVRPGETVSLIGPNGAGKSTLLRTLARYLEKRCGTVFIEGKDIAEINPAELARIMSVTFTERIRPELMTCREVAEMGRYPYTGRFGILTDKDKNAVSNAIKETNSESFADELFNSVSDGQRQRIILAKAICQEPKILILDEPTSYLDIKHKIGFFEIIRRLAKEKNIAVIISIHEIRFAEKISDKVICIKNGKIAARGTPAEIFHPETIMELYDISPELYEKYFS